MSSFDSTRPESSRIDPDDSIQPIDPCEVLLSGYLTKEGGGWKSWKRRFFVLSFGGILNYYEDDTMRKPKGSLDCSTSFSYRMLPELSEFHFEIDSEVVSTKSERKLRVCAEDEDSRDQWISCFQLLLLKLRKGTLITGDQSGDQETYMKGYLTKEGGNWKSWKRRYFVLKKNGTMNYYEDGSMAKLKGTLSVKDAEVNPCPEGGDLAFEIVSDIFSEGTGRSLKVQADDDEQMSSWMRAVRVISCMYGDKDEVIADPAKLAATSNAVDSEYSRRLSEPIARIGDP